MTPLIPLRPLLAAVALLALTTCTSSKNEVAGEENEPPRAVYYWKTVFKLNNWERQFLERHNIRRIYLRVFDIHYSRDNDGTHRSVPIATTRFADTVPAGIEIVPTVFITKDAMKNDPDFAEELYTRVKAMVKANNLGPTREIQLDCDFYSSQEESFTKLCRHVVELAHADSVLVSATLRLHQLGNYTPPADRAALMLYNTESIHSNATSNSIITLKSVENYVNRKIACDIPVDIALPTYQWGVLKPEWYPNWLQILHHSDYSDSTLYRQVSPNKYAVTSWHVLDGKCLYIGDTIRFERAEHEVVAAARDRVTSRVTSPGRPGVILYHLDSLNLSKYSSEQIEQLYSTH